MSINEELTVSSQVSIIMAKIKSENISPQIKKLLEETMRHFLLISQKEEPEKLQKAREYFIFSISMLHIFVLLLEDCLFVLSCLMFV